MWVSLGKVGKVGEAMGNVRDAMLKVGPGRLWGSGEGGEGTGEHREGPVNVEEAL